MHSNNTFSIAQNRMTSFFNYTSPPGPSTHVPVRLPSIESCMFNANYVPPPDHPSAFSKYSPHKISEGNSDGSESPEDTKPSPKELTTLTNLNVGSCGVHPIVSSFRSLRQEDLKQEIPTAHPYRYEIVKSDESPSSSDDFQTSSDSYQTPSTPMPFLKPRLFRSLGSISPDTVSVSSSTQLDEYDPYNSRSGLKLECDEYHDASDPTDSSYLFKRRRVRFTEAQLVELERYFEQNKYPDVHARQKIADETGISATRIQVWFQNRRAKMRKISGVVKAHPVQNYAMTQVGPAPPAMRRYRSPPMLTPGLRTVCWKSPTGNNTPWPGTTVYRNSYGDPCYVSHVVSPITSLPTAYRQRIPASAANTAPPYGAYYTLRPTVNNTGSRPVVYPLPVAQAPIARHGQPF